MPSRSSSQPGNEPDVPSSPIRPCSRWGLAVAASPQPTGRSYRPISTLPLSARRRVPENAGVKASWRRYVSVPLSVSRPAQGRTGSLGVTQHPVRWSPDFPPPQETCGGGHPVLLAPPSGTLAQAPRPVKKNRRRRPKAGTRKTSRQPTGNQRLPGGERTQLAARCRYSYPVSRASACGRSYCTTRFDARSEPAGGVGWAGTSGRLDTGRAPPWLPLCRPCSAAALHSASIPGR